MLIVDLFLLFYFLWFPAVFSVLDLLGDDGLNSNTEENPVPEAHVAFSVEGITYHGFIWITCILVRIYFCCSHLNDNPGDEVYCIGQTSLVFYNKCSYFIKKRTIYRQMHLLPNTILGCSYWIFFSLTFTTKISILNEELLHKVLS